MITIHQIRAARALLGLKQQDLAHKAHISLGTLNNIERAVQTDPKVSTLLAIQRALEAEGVEFLTTAAGEGVLLKTAHRGAHSSTILIIDDSLADRTLYRTWLNQQPYVKYNIIEADNAHNGYDAFINHAPACIILDFMMYGKDGFQLLMAMKKEHTSLPPIIFMTGMHSDVVERGALAQGVHCYLNKNKLTAAQLREAVADALNSITKEAIASLPIVAAKAHKDEIGVRF